MRFRKVLEKFRHLIFYFENIDFENKQKSNKETT